MPGSSQGRVGTLRVLRPVGAHLGGLAVVVVVVVLDVVALGVVLVGLGAVGLAVRVPGKRKWIESNDKLRAVAVEHFQFEAR